MREPTFPIDDREALLEAIRAGKARGVRLPRVDLSGCDLRGVDLSEARLSGANLSGQT